MSFLLEVSKNNHQGVLKALTETPEDIKQTDKNGNTALHIASEKGLHQMVEILIEHGAKLNSQNKCPGWTAAHFAAYEGHAEILQLLLESGAKPDVKDWQGDTAETWALDWENYKCAMLLADATKKSSPVKDKTSQSSTKDNGDVWTPEDESKADTFDSDDDSDDDDDDDEELTHWVLPLPKPIPPVTNFSANPSNIPNLSLTQPAQSSTVMQQELTCEEPPLQLETSENKIDNEDQVKDEQCVHETNQLLDDEGQNSDVVLNVAVIHNNLNKLYFNTVNNTISSETKINIFT